MKPISRRVFIRSAGVALALPLVESVVPAQVPLAQVATSPKSRPGGIVRSRAKYRRVPTSKGLLLEDEQGWFRYAIRGDEVFKYAHFYFGWGLRSDKAHLWETICRYRGSVATAMIEEIMTAIKESEEVS